MVAKLQQGDDTGDMNESRHPRLAEHVVIIGGGFSGALQAINLLRHDGPRATLIERRKHVARGVAYSAAHPDHLLNVRAMNMSALPDDPGHFLRWLEARRTCEGATFAPRILYGDYLAELLEETAATAPDRLDVLQDEAVGLAFERGRSIVVLRSGNRLTADVVILALGNLPPHDPPGIDGENLSQDRYASDPWAGDVADGLAAEDLVLLIGTGLTMVDTALLLEARGFKGKIVALSRRGLLPHAHAAANMASVPISERPLGPASRLVRQVRERASAIGWRGAVDELRSFTQAMWLSASPPEQARFLRHLRPWWDIHRHRLAPDVARRIAAMQRSGRLDIAAGKLISAESHQHGVRVSWRVRGKDDVRVVDARRVINCTGPQGDLLRTREPLLRELLAGGVIRADRHRLGIEVTPQSETVDARGYANPRLLALGPMTRGTFWEIVAVPDIRLQTWNVARRLSHAHWVEGEGL